MVTLDDLDRAVVHALHLDGRASFSRIAEVLDVSTQTVARRYRRLRAEAGLRVVGLPDRGRGGLTQWMVRLTCAPSATQPLAQSLARRPDTSWVKLTSGGTEIFTIVHTPADAGDAHAMLLHDIPRRTGITGVSAHCLLHTYLGGPTAWRGILQALDERQQALLRPPPPAEEGDGPAPADQALLDVLRLDGRATYADLAAATGRSQATVARRLAVLRGSGAIFFDVDVESGPFGVAAQALLWMSVAPAKLDEVAVAIARHHEMAVVAATTGPTNLLAEALCAGPADLHRYLTRRLAVLEGVHAVETAPVLRILKRTGALLPAGLSAGLPAGRVSESARAGSR